MYILDTDHVTLYQQGYAALGQRIAGLSPEELGTTVITYEEQLQGRLAVVRRARTVPERLTAYYWLRRTLDFFCRFPVIPFVEGAAKAFQHLKDLKLRIGTQDLLIAAIALSRQTTVVTRNQRDFGRIPDLLIDDWSLSTDFPTANP